MDEISRGTSVTFIEKCFLMVVPTTRLLFIYLVQCTMWNNAPTDIKNASSIGMAKSAIKKFARTLEI